MPHPAAGTLRSNPFALGFWDPYDPRKDTPSLMKFPQFPAEIRAMIWKFAIPDPREVLGAITFITNYDLSSARAILPSPRDLNAVYRIIRALNHTRSFGDEWGIGKGQTEQDKVNSLVLSWDGLIALLHTSHEARIAVQHRFHLDCRSTIPGKRERWWDENDELYFPGFRSQGRQKVTREWLSLSRKDRSPRSSQMPTIRNLALPLNTYLMQRLDVDFRALMGGFNPYLRAREPKDGDLMDSWLENFPHLASLTLLPSTARRASPKESHLTLPVFDFDQHKTAHLTDGISCRKEPEARDLLRFNPDSILSVISCTTLDGLHSCTTFKGTFSGS